jgi:hypothetical protein
MTHEDEGHYALKHEGRELDERIAAAVKARHVGVEFPCGVAETVGQELGVPLSEVGVTLDLLEIKICGCEIGMFGHETESGKHAGFVPAASVPDELEAAIRGGLVEGKLTCAAAWKIAADQGLGRIEVGAACEGLGIKISKCQLGAFKSGRGARG